MTDAELGLDHKTFDLVAAIEGRTYPEIEVPICFDERAANAIYNTDKELQRLLPLGKADEYEELEKVYFGLIEDLKDVIYKVTVRSVDRKTKKAWVAKAQAKHPDKQADMLGNVKPNPEGLAYLELLQWQSMIVRIEGPDGAVVQGPFDEATVESLMDRAPDASLAAIAEAIEELTNGAKSGYEQAVRNLDFSHGVSSEATPDVTPEPSE